MGTSRALVRFVLGVAIMAAVFRGVDAASLAALALALQKLTAE
jgi:hypothetical protein